MTIDAEVRIQLYLETLRKSLGEFGATCQRAMAITAELEAASERRRRELNKLFDDILRDIDGITQSGGNHGS